MCASFFFSDLSAQCTEMLGYVHVQRTMIFRMPSHTRRKRKKKSEREKGKEQGRCYLIIHKTKEKNDPSVIHLFYIT